MRLAVLFVTVVMSFPALAQSSQTVTYMGGTVPNLKSESEGRLDVSDPSSIAFVYPGGRLTIGFSSMESYEYSRQVVHHLGVLPAIAVGLVKARMKSHLFRITYRDERNVSQVTVFRVPKQLPSTLLPIFAARAPQATHPCPAYAYRNCFDK